MKEKWMLQMKKGDFNGLAKQFGVSPLIIKILVNKGINTPEEIEQYFHGDLKDLHNPWLLKGMEKGIELARMQKGDGGDGTGKIAIASDFDCDGIFSGYILKQGLTRAGIDCKLYTPDRVKEGYGLNNRIVDECIEGGCTMILTCDNGIAAFEAVEYAVERGLTVVVTDHHEIQEKLPVAQAVIDPKQEGCQYPYKELCGTGVAFKFVQALYEKEGISKEELKPLLQYVAMATVADVMDLTEENRILVREGLKVLEGTENLGMRELIKAQGLEGKKLQAYHIGFVLGPCFNASGRLMTVKLAFDLLDETNREEAAKLAAELKSLNDERKMMTETGTGEALKILEQRESKKGLPDVIVIALPDCHESLVGIIAGRIKEKYHRPTIVFTNTEGECLKGSGRSIEPYDMFANLMECKNLMLRFGGHPMAAGMTIKSKDLEELDQRLNENSKLTADDFRETVYIDANMPVRYISEELIDQLSLIEPLGKGNTKPIFAGQHFLVQRMFKRGEAGRVLSLQLVENGTKIDGVMFGKTEEFEDFIREEYGENVLRELYQGTASGVDVAFTYYPGINEYRGYRNLQLQLGSFCRV